MPELIPAAPGSPDWLAARRAGVTATDIVTILGLSAWNSAYSLYWQKMGQVPEPADNDRFRLGRELEGYVRERWEESGEHYAKPGGGAGLYQHSDRAWQMATPDSVSLDGEPCKWKTWADADRCSWDGAPPAKVRAQVLWQMDVMGAAAGHVGVVFLPSGEFRSYVVKHENCGQDEPGIDRCSACSDLEVMAAAGEEFMARLRHELPPPDPDASAATLAAVKARFTKAPDKQAEIDRLLWDQWTQTKASANHLEMLLRGTEARIREQAGEASVLTVDGQPVARRYVMDQQVKAHTRHMDYLKRINGSNGE